MRRGEGVPWAIYHEIARRHQKAREMGRSWKLGRERESFCGTCPVNAKAIDARHTPMLLYRNLYASCGNG